MKTKEELNALKEEVETQNKKLHELTDEELAQVSGGVVLTEDTSVSTLVPSGDHASMSGALSTPNDVIILSE